MDKQIKSVTFKNNPNTVEHQWFPVEYFSGSDVTIYFGDVFLSECTSLEFGIDERVMPIYGYASHTWDEVARGTRIVSGRFVVPFTEAGYLDAILMHIGQYTTDLEKVKPKLAYTLAGEAVPGWAADYKMTIEGLFDKFDPSQQQVSQSVSQKIIKIGTYSTDVITLKTLLNEKVGYQETPLSTWIKNQYGTLSESTCESAIKEHSTNSGFITALQRTLNHIYASDGINRYSSKTTTYEIDGEIYMQKLSSIPISGKMDIPTSESLNIILNWFKYTGGKPTSNGMTILNKEMLCFLVGFTADEKYAPQTFLQVTAMQRLENLTANGDYALKDTTSHTDGYGVNQNLSRYDDRLTQHESEIWGRDMSADYDRKHQTYFYTDRYRHAGLDGEAMLKKYGFDIYITYGPGVEAQQYSAWATSDPVNAEALDTYSFNTTVKAIRNVQITSSHQIIGANGSPISEVYTFMAKDLD